MVGLLVVVLWLAGLNIAVRGGCLWLVTGFWFCGFCFIFGGLGVGGFSKLSAFFSNLGCELFGLLVGSRVG